MSMWVQTECRSRRRRKEETGEELPSTLACTTLCRTYGPGADMISGRSVENEMRGPRWSRQCDSNGGTESRGGEEGGRREKRKGILSLQLAWSDGMDE